MRTASLTALVTLLVASAGSAQSETPRGWLSWRGPQQAGTTAEANLPDRVSVDGGGSWTYRIRGRGTPVVADGRVYALGYEGEGKDLQESLLCLDEETGEKVWEHRWGDFLTDVIYSRYAIGSPTIDPQTGDVFCLTTAGLLKCLSPAGELRWERSMMSEYGRLSFPNGRTGAPLVVEDMVIVHVISSAWGPHAPARDRFYAFGKADGTPIWSATPGGPPKDSSFSFPVVEERDGRLLMYAGLGGGYMVCVDARTGETQWRFRMATGGVNSSALLHGDSLIAIHGKENVDNSTIGRMISIRLGAEPSAPGKPAELGAEHENWRSDLVAFTSSPVLVGDRIYQTVATGELECVDANTGEVVWHKKLAPDQIHASPAFGDGKLYVPMNNGTFYVLRPGDEDAEVLQELQLEGNCLGAPAIANGRIYVHTTERLYSFAGGGDRAPEFVGQTDRPPVGAATALQVVPGDLLLRQGDSVAWVARSLDARGLVVSPSVEGVEWSGLPDGVTIANGVLTVAAHAAPWAGVVSAKTGDLAGSARLRIVPAIPFADNFEDAPAGPPRRHWVGAMKKWEVLDRDGNKVLAKTLENPLFQRTMTLIGHPEQRDYTMQVDILTDGNRRMMSSAGVVNQRYQIVLKGNHQTLEVSSNMELVKESVKYKWKARTWYRLKTRVDVSDDGSGVVRAKVWPRDDAEPDAWTLEVAVPHAHTQGSPGIYGFTPQSRFRVYLDNLSVTANE